MPWRRTPSTSSIPKALDPVKWISLRYTGVSSHRAGPCTPSLTRVPRARSSRDADLEGLTGADGVVDHVDAPGEGHGQAVGGLQDTAGPAGDLVDDVLAWLVGDRRGAELLGHPALVVEAGHDHHVDRRVERTEDGNGAQAEGAGAVDQHLAVGLGRVAGDAVK